MLRSQVRILLGTYLYGQIYMVADPPAKIVVLLYVRYWTVLYWSESMQCIPTLYLEPYTSLIHLQSYLQIEQYLTRFFMNLEYCGAGGGGSNNYFLHIRLITCYYILFINIRKPKLVSQKWSNLERISKDSIMEIVGVLSYLLIFQKYHNI